MTDEPPFHQVWFRLIGRDVAPCANLHEWSRGLLTSERWVGSTNVGPFNVSTVFIGFDHNQTREAPRIFETMILVNETGFKWNGEYRVHSDTWLDAEQEHKRTIDHAIELTKKHTTFLRRNR